MIRRPPTAITISSVEVAELKAYREKVAAQQAAEKNKDKDAAGASISHTTESMMAGGDSMQAQNGDGSDGAQEHPADRAARLRRERTAAERIGL